MMFWYGVVVTDIRGGCVAIGICETMGADEAMFWVVDEGMVETAGVTDVEDASVKANKGPSCDMTGEKAGEGNVEPEGADAE
ncbi:hypothetical protein KI387_028792, partial [Taxus chinensis]